MDNEMLKMLIELVIVIAFFFLGRYVLPKNKINIQNAAIQFEVLLNYAESFCAYARQFLNCSGEEKMDSVVEKLRAICEKQGIDIDDETLRAIGQKAYDAMKAGEKAAVVLESAVEEIKEFVPSVEETTEEDRENTGSPVEE